MEAAQLTPVEAAALVLLRVARARAEGLSEVAAVLVAVAELGADPARVLAQARTAPEAP